MQRTNLISRRALIGVGIAAVIPGYAVRSQETAPSSQDDTPSAKLPRPDMAGLPRTRVTDYENDPFIVGVESQLRCTCGCNLSVYTCRTTDFTCQTSPAMHRHVIGFVEQGRTAEEILDEFVTLYGETVLMAPRKEGFNLAAYLVPGFGITLVGAAMLWVLTRRTHRREPEGAGTATGESSSYGLSADDASRLTAELEKLDG